MKQNLGSFIDFQKNFDYKIHHIYLQLQWINWVEDLNKVISGLRYYFIDSANTTKMYMTSRAAQYCLASRMQPVGCRLDSPGLVPVYLSNSIHLHTNYSLIAFNERVTFWLQHVQSLPWACAYVALFGRRLTYNHYAIAHAYNTANMHAQGSDPARWRQKVTLSSKAIGV